MSIPSGTFLGPHEILEQIGAGGMGEVYKARDTRLNRTVAIKVLPEGISSRPEVKARFEREAQTIAALNHPGICTLYDIGRQDGIDYLVMEYVDGETLERKLARGPLAVDQALKIGAEIANALHNAHREGVIHRDLKPGNIMLTKSGTKLLDFGLAKLRGRDVAATAGLSSMPTKAPVTAEGTLLGTLQYMAPEQFEGREADARTDIFAFGAVLYEMVTGKRAFDGTSQASIIAAILDRQPSAASSLQPAVTQILDELISRCLAKDPDNRWQTSRDIELQMRWIAENAAAGAEKAVHQATVFRREWIAWAMVTALVLFSAQSAITRRWRAREDAGNIVRFDVYPPDNLHFEGLSAPAVSPNGRFIAYVAGASGKPAQIWVRPMDSVVAQPLPGTEGAWGLFWSPDSESIGFVASGLRRISRAGTDLRTICPAQPGAFYGGSWSRQNVIVFGNGFDLFQVDAGGGTPKPLPGGGEGIERVWPQFLPDGQHYLYVRTDLGTPQSEQSGISVGSLGSEESKLLVSGFVMNAVFAPPGSMLYIRDGTLFSQQLDPNKLELTGEAVPLVENAGFVFGAAFRSSVSVSDTGVLAYWSGIGRFENQLEWSSRDGTSQGTVASRNSQMDLEISPDGKRVALETMDRRVTTADLWIVENSAGAVPRRFTFDRSWDAAPRWSRDGERIAFNMNPVFGNWRLILRSASGGGQDDVVLDTKSFVATDDWSRDGRYLIYEQLDRKSKWDIWAMNLTDRKTSPIVVTGENDAMGRLSPDGKYLAYASESTGRPEVWVKPFLSDGAGWQITTSGALAPRWRRDGKELFFTTLDGKLMATPIRSVAPSFVFDTPQLLFQTKLTPFPNLQFARWGYDVAADGQRFLINNPVEPAPSPFTVVLNWQAALGKK